MPNHPVQAVANAFLRLAMAEGVTLSNMRLQKLPYIAEGWSLALLNQPLVAEAPVTYAYGPVYESLYRALREYGAGPVGDLIHEADGTRVAELGGARGAVVAAEFTQDETALIAAVWQAYKGYSVYQLAALTHGENSPWTVTRAAGEGRQPIPRKLMRDHYALLAREPAPAQAAGAAPGGGDRFAEIAAHRAAPVVSAAARQAVAAEEAQLNNDQLRAQIDDIRALTRLKLEFGQQILAYLWAFSGFCALVLLLQGFAVYRFTLSEKVLLTLVGGTAASAFGLVSVVLGGLFRNTAPPAKPDSGG